MVLTGKFAFTNLIYYVRHFKSQCFNSKTRLNTCAAMRGAVPVFLSFFPRCPSTFDHMIESNSTKGCQKGAKNMRKMMQKHWVSRSFFGTEAETQCDLKKKDILQFLLGLVASMSGQGNITPLVSTGLAVQPHNLPCQGSNAIGDGGEGLWSERHPVGGRFGWDCALTMKLGAARNSPELETSEGFKVLGV